MAEDHGSIEVTVTSVPSNIQISQTAGSATVAVEDNEDWATVSVDRAAVRVKESRRHGDPRVKRAHGAERDAVRDVGDRLDQRPLVWRRHGAPRRGLRDHYENVTFAATDFQLENGRQVAHKTVDVTILNNHAGRWEGDETFTLKVERHPSLPGSVIIVDVDGNYAVDGSIMTVTIAEDQAPPALSLSASPAFLENQGDTSTVRVSSTNGVGFALEQTIDLEFGGTAVQGTDYSVSSETLILAAGALSSAAATVTVLGDPRGSPTQLSVRALRGGSPIGTREVSLGAAPPDAPGNLRATTPYELEVWLSWDKPAFDGGLPIVHYEVRIDDQAWWKALNHDGPRTHREFTTATRRTLYVRAVNAAGAGPAASVEAVAFGQDCAADGSQPCKPRAPKYLRVRSSDSSRADLDWDDWATTEPDGYRVEVSRDEGATWSVAADTGSAAQEWSDTGLSGTEIRARRYRVRAVNAHGAGNPSEPARLPETEIARSARSGARTPRSRCG